MQGRKQYWEEFNENDGDVNIRENGKIKKATSYTHFFFDRFKLDNFLKNQNKRMLQLGVSNGKFLKDYQAKGWDVIGYDYCDSLVGQMNNNNIPFRNINLNSTHNNKLTYEDKLEADCKTSTHVLAIRILEYLDPKTVPLLVFALMDKAKPDTTYFFVHATSLQNKPEKFSENYIASYFGPRTDIKFLFFDALVHNKDKDKDKDEVLVVRKLSTNP